MSLPIEGLRRNIKKGAKGAVVVGATVLIASTCNDKVDLPNCTDDPQPKTTEVNINSNSILLVGDVRITLGNHPGEFDTERLATGQDIEIVAIDHGVAFRHEETKRSVEITGQEWNSAWPLKGKETKIIVKTSCDTPK